MSQPAILRVIRRLHSINIKPAFPCCAYATIVTTISIGADTASTVATSRKVACSSKALRMNKAIKKTAPQLSTQPLRLVTVLVAYRKPGNVISRMPVPFEITHQGNGYTIVPFCTAAIKRLLNLPDNLYFEVNGTGISCKNALLPVVEDILEGITILPGQKQAAVARRTPAEKAFKKFRGLTPESQPEPSFFDRKA